MTETAYPAITGVGEGLPSRVITNQELIEITGIDSNPAWIEAHTGIKSRRWVESGESLSDLAVIAARGALSMSGAAAEDLTAIYYATTTPEYVNIGSSSIVHGRIGAAEECLSVDLKAACAGGITGLEAASHRLQVEGGSALVIGANTLSRLVNTQDRRTVILFGDGAGATVVKNVEGAARPYSVMFTQPNLEAIHIPPGGKIHMDGPTVKKHAIDMMSRTSERVAQKAGLFDPTEGINWDEIDFLIPHQANHRLIEDVGEVIGVPEEKCVVTVDEHGNTSSASVFLALHEAWRRGQIPPGRSRVLFTAIGAGFVGGAVIMDAILPERAH